MEEGVEEEGVGVGGKARGKDYGMEFLSGGERRLACA